MVSMKKILIYISVSAIMLGCSAPRNDERSMFVSIAPLRALVSEIVGDDFEIGILVPAGASPESFEPTPKQFIALNNAELVFNVGLIDFERNLLSKVADKDRIVDLSRGIELIAGSCSHHHHAGHNHTHGVDPHIWSSPKALKIMARNAFEAIHALYPDSAKYETAYGRLQERLDTLDNIVSGICASADNRYFVVYHPALTYLARDYGLEQISIEHEGKEPSARYLATIIERARRDGIDRIFYQSQFPKNVVETVAADIGAEPVEIDPLQEDIFSGIEHITRLITE